MSPPIRDVTFGRSLACVLGAGLSLALVSCGPEPATPDRLPLPGAAPVAPAEAVAFAAGESAVLTGAWSREANAFVLQARALASGAPSSAFPPLPLQLSGRTPGAFAYDPAHTRLALVTGTGPWCTRMSGGSACRNASESLHLIDLHLHTETTIDLGVRGFVPALALHPDDGRVALARQNSDGFEVLVFSPEDGARLHAVSLDFLPSWIGYSLDGEEIFVAGANPGDDPGITPPGPLTVAIYAAESLERLWQEPLDVVHDSWCLEGCGDSHEQVLLAYWTPALVRLPDTDRLVIVHADSDRMTSIDFAERSATTYEIAARLPWIDRWMALGTEPAEAKGGSQGAIRSAVASLDGARVFTVGQTLHAGRNPEGHWDSWNEPMELLVFDPATGLLLDSRPSQAERVRLSADGAWLVLSRWGPEGPRLETLDPETLAPGPSLANWDPLIGLDIAGSPILLGRAAGDDAPRTAGIDPTTFKIGKAWELPGEVFLFP